MPMKRAIGRFQLSQVVGASQAVDVHQIDVVHLQALQASFQAAQEAVACAVGNLGGEKDLLTPRGHDLAHARLALAVAVGIGRVQVGDAEVDGAVERLERRAFILVHEEAAAAAEGQDGDAGPGAPEHSMGKGLNGGGGSVHDVLENWKPGTRGRAQGYPAKKLPTRKVFAHGSSFLKVGNPRVSGFVSWRWPGAAGRQAGSRRRWRSV
jgi:hypothetical protein